jgi:endonuclease-3
MATSKAKRTTAVKTPSAGKRPKPGKARPASKSRGKSAAPEVVAERLSLAVPEARCELRHRNAFELLIATILSAQSTDKMVNAVTLGLFERWPTPAALAAAGQEEVEEVVKRTGFFRNKAKAIRGAAAALVSEHGGQVPRTMDEMVSLPGVARKTANVVLGTAYGISSGFVVDTHVARVAQRLGLTAHDGPGDIETDLRAHFAEDTWVDMGHRILLHGRYTCLAKNPLCSDCPLNELCPSRQTSAAGSWQERAHRECQRVDAGFAASGA